MRKVLFYLLLVIALPAISQVKFDMFKFKRYGTPLIKSNWLILNMNYKITSDKKIRYFELYYAGVNEKDDAVYDEIRQTPVLCSKGQGPYHPRETYRRYNNHGFWYGGKIKPFPLKITIYYADLSEEDIYITKDNIEELFPCVKWRDIYIPEDIDY